MSKSDLRKNASKTIVVPKVNGWNDFRGISAGVVETGVSILSLPIKAEIHINHIQMIGEISSAIANTQTNVYGITIENSSGLPARDLAEMMNTTFVVINQRIDLATAVGIFDGSKEISEDVDVLISRQSNLASATEIDVVPWYRSSASINLSTRGVVRYTLTIFQQNFRDATDEWAGYTFEESVA